MFVKSFSPIAIIFLLFLFLGGCAGPVIRMPKTLPSIVKEYKSFKLYAGMAGMYDTGVSVIKGDYVTLIPRGYIDVGGNNPILSRLLYRIGKKGYCNWDFYRVDLSPKNTNIINNGNIYLGYHGGYELDQYCEPPSSQLQFYRDDTGHYDIDIIVWEKEDPIQIADFLEAVLEDPKNEILQRLVQGFKVRKKVLLAEEEAKKEVEEAQKALLALKEEKPPDGKEEEVQKGGPVSEGGEEKLQEEAKQAIEDLKKKEALGIKDVQKEKQMAELTDKLQKALQSLKELEEMKKKLAEQQEKEKQLMTRLEQVEAEKLKQSQNPPVIAIGTPKDGVNVDSEYVNLFGVVEHDKGIEKFEILVNQQLVGRKAHQGLKAGPADSKRIDFAERVRLREGKNEISVIAQDKDGLKTQKTISIQWVKKRDEVWAVVIGIDKYKNFPSLKYSANDARGFYRYLTEGNQVPKDHVWLLLDEEASLNKMRSVLGTQLRRNAGKDDMVIVYLAGHGATEKDTASPDGDGLEKYILPQDADPKDLYASAMPMSEVARIFARINSERLVFISDTCYSGATGGRTVPVMGMRANVSGAFWDRLSQGTGRVIITASDANEVSMEKDDLKHGVFTYYLLEALQGKGDLDGDGVITVDEVYRYVSMKVPQATYQEQHPVKKGEMKGQIVLGIVH